MHTQPKEDGTHVPFGATSLNCRKMSEFDAQEVTIRCKTAKKYYPSGTSSDATVQKSYLSYATSVETGRKRALLLPTPPEDEPKCHLLWVNACETAEENGSPSLLTGDEHKNAGKLAYLPKLVAYVIEGQKHYAPFLSLAKHTNTDDDAPKTGESWQQAHCLPPQVIAPRKAQNADCVVCLDCRVDQSN